jgi:photosystem II stability/assembly factor-like uncharacterized protein
MNIQIEHQPVQEETHPPVYEQETFGQTPGQPPPQPPRPPQRKRERWYILGALILILVLVVGSVFAVELSRRPAPSPTPTPITAKTPTHAPTAATTPTPAPTKATTPTPKPTATPTPVPPAPVYQPINTLWMSTATTGWARATGQRIVRTTDGGKHWQNVTPPYPAGYTGTIPPVFASLNQNVAWVAVFEKQQPDGTMPNVVFRTSNGGQSWQEATLPTGSLGVSQVQFINAQDGWALTSFGGSGMGSQAVALYRSTDGGQTWRFVARAGYPGGTIPLQGMKSGMSWLSTSTGWITGAINAAQNYVYLYRTQDGGVTWQQQSLPLPAGQALVTTDPPIFFSATDGLLPVTFSTPQQGVSLMVYATQDGGATWSSSTLLPNIGTTWNEDLLSMQQGWVAANGGTLYETSDSGQHWTALTPSSNFQAITQLDFVSAQEGWAISMASPSAPHLLQTMDGGQSWVQISPGPQATSWKVVTSPNVGTANNILNDVVALSASNIWAVGVYQNVSGPYQTLTEHWNGTTWQMVSSPSPGASISWLDSAAAVSASDIWAVGYYQNGAGPGTSHALIEHWNGANWQVVPGPNPGTDSNGLYGVAALSATNVWVVGLYANIAGPAQTLIEHWNGTSWQVVSSPNVGTGGDSLSSVAAISASDIWAVGSYQNGAGSTALSQTLIEQWNGTSWQVVSSPNVGTVPNRLSSVAAVSASDVWAVGYQYVTSQIGTGFFPTLIEHWNGINWQVVASPNPGTGGNRLNGVAVINASNIWAVGYYEHNPPQPPAPTLTEQYS